MGSKSLEAKSGKTTRSAGVAEQETPSFANPTSLTTAPKPTLARLDPEPETLNPEPQTHECFLLRHFSFDQVYAITWTALGLGIEGFKREMSFKRADP